MSYSKLWISAFSLATVAFTGCTNEEDLGGRTRSEDGGMSSDASKSSDASRPTDGDPPIDLNGKMRYWLSEDPKEQRAPFGKAVVVRTYPDGEVHLDIKDSPKGAIRLDFGTYRGTRTSRDEAGVYDFELACDQADDALCFFGKTVTFLCASYGNELACGHISFHEVEPSDVF